MMEGLTASRKDGIHQFCLHFFSSHENSAQIQIFRQQHFQVFIEYQCSSVIPVFLTLCKGLMLQ